MLTYFVHHIALLLFNVFNLYGDTATSGQFIYIFISFFEWSPYEASSGFKIEILLSLSQDHY